ncbi:MAG: glycosyltransferase family 1 protein [Bacteroidia bacterium]
MRVALDSRFLRPPLEGFGRFTREIGQRLVRQHPEVTWDFLFDRSPVAGYTFGQNQRNFVLFPPTRHWLLYEMWWRWAVPAYLARHRPNVLLATYGQASAQAAHRVRVVAFIHDVAFARYPDHLPKGWQRYYLRTTQTVVQHATILLANSQSVAYDLMELFDAPKERLRVVYNGCDTSFFQPISEAERHATRQYYTQGLPYLLYVGSFHPRKNLLHLFQAYDILRSWYKEPLRLLVVGRILFGARAFKRAYQRMRYKAEVIFHPPLGDEELRKVYGAAEALVYPSWYEGFGYPVVEAMACGTLVVTSNTSSLPEVGGPAAFYADPGDPEAIASQLYQALTLTPTERERRLLQGRAHAQHFSWEACVSRIWQALIEA